MDVSTFIDSLNVYYAQEYTNNTFKYESHRLQGDIHRYNSGNMESKSAEVFVENVSRALCSVVTDIYWKSLEKRINYIEDTRVSFSISTLTDDEHYIYWNSEHTHYSTYLVTKLGFDESNPEFEYVYSLVILISRLFDVQYLHDFIEDHLNRISDSIVEFKIKNPNQILFS